MEEILSFYDMIKKIYGDGNLSVDIYGDNLSSYSQEELDNILVKKRTDIPSIYPYIRKRDLNNQNQKDINDCNKPVDAWEIGINVNF